jgi:fibro-slime domain-containing protein
MQKTSVSLLYASAVAVAFLALQLQAQTAPLQIPVTFYDFHADGSNPDFEPGLYTCGLVGCITPGSRTNEVQTTLDAERKPLLGTTPLFSQRVAKWFRPWQAGDFTAPLYSLTGAYLGDTTLPADTAYKNVVILDTLTLNAIGNGLYQLNSPAFFRLDGKGFGADDPGGQDPPHNFGFTMELHWEFVSQPDLTFTFSGDDDVWVFINGQRVIDLGGIHGPSTATVNLNTLGLTTGQKYKFDLFYAERHVTGSDILITTNIFTPAGAIHLYGNNNPPITPTNPPPLGPLDTAIAGQGFPLYVHVFDTAGVWTPKWDSTVAWTITSQTGLGNPVLTTQTGGSTVLIPEKAFGTVTITATYTDPQTQKKLTTTITVWINPGKGTHVVIEADSLAANTRADRLISVITVDKITPVTVYAVVRDTFGNFVSMAANAAWQVQDPSIAAVTPGQGKATTVSELLFGQTVLTATVPGLVPGTAPINAVGPNDAIPVTAVMLDKNGNGHLDRIDLVYPSGTILLSTLPSARAWITDAGIISYDGNKAVNLVIDSLRRGNGDTIHVYLTENTEPTLETGWLEAHVTLTSAPVTSEQRAFTVTKIVDGAAPVIKRLCFVPTPAADTLRVYFSEPVNQTNKPGDENSYFAIILNGTPTGDKALSVINQNDRLLYVYKGNTLNDMDSVKEGSRPLFPLGLCGDVSIVRSYHVASNPFIPRVTEIPISQRDPNNPAISKGTRIEVSLIPAIKQKLIDGQIRGTLSIFDAVGNTIIENQPMSVNVPKAELFRLWNGLTRKGNYAGGGTYLARITIEDLSRNKIQVMRAAVGVKQQ